MPSCSTIARTALLALVLGTGVALSSQDPATPKAPVNRFVNSVEGVAIHGYDPVAYVEDNEAVRGDPAFTASWRGAEWRFASAGNRARFLEDPQAFAPQYGGFEAYGVALGKAYDVDPSVFDVVEGRLYLHRNERVRELWQRNPIGYIAEADEEWRRRAAGTGNP